MEPQSTLNWQVSISDTAEVVTDINDIVQAIYLILTTVKGSDPLRPLFGSEVWRYLDKPMNRVDPMLIYEIYDAVEKWEKRVLLRRVAVREIDFDKKTIELIGIMVGSSEEVEMQFNLWEDKVETYFAIYDPDQGFLSDENNNILVLI